MSYLPRPGGGVCVESVFNVNGNCTLSGFVVEAFMISTEMIQRFSLVSELQTFVGFQTATPAGIPERPDTSAPLWAALLPPI